MPTTAQRFQIAEVTRAVADKDAEDRHLRTGIEVVRIPKARPAALRVQVDAWTRREQVDRQKINRIHGRIAASHTALLVEGTHRRRDDHVSEMMDTVEIEERRAKRAKSKEQDKRDRSMKKR